MDQLLEELLLNRKDGLFELIQKRINVLYSSIKWAESGPKLAREILVKTLQLSIVVNQLKQHIQEFEPSPRLLDLKLSQFVPRLIEFYESNRSIKYDPVNRVFSAVIGKGIAEVIYHFSHVRGFKHITHYFPSDIYKLHKLIQWFKQADLVSDDEQFLILMWLCNLVMVPFELESVTDNASRDIYGLTLQHLQKYPQGSKNQLVALILLSRLLSRDDQANLLDEYCTDFQQLWNSNRLGNMLTMNKLMKRIPTIKAKTVSVVLQDMFHSGKIAEKSSSLEIVYIIKLINRSCHASFQENEIPYNYISGMIDALFKKILRPLFTLGQCDINIRYASAKALAQIAVTLSHHATNYFHQVIQFVIDELDLPMNGECFEKELKIDFEIESIAKYQTVILFLGYLGFFHALPSSYILQVCSITHKTLFFKQRNVNVMIGTQVRDSSCFALWTMLKSLKKEEFLKVFAFETRQYILFDLIKTTLYDEEIVIRRCALAVLQEYIGRFGSLVFSINDPVELGAFIIKFIELFDMSSISTLTNSFAITAKLEKIGLHTNLLLVPHLLDIVEDDNVPFMMKKIASETLNYTFTTHEQDFNIEWQFQNIEPCTIDRVTSRLLKSLKSHKLGSQYALASVAIAVFDGSCDDVLKSAVAFLQEYPIKINLHNRNLHEEVEELIFLYFAYLNSNEADDEFMDHLWTTLYEVFGLSHSSQITSKLQVLFDVIDQDGLNKQVYERMIHFLKNGSMILADTIGHLDLNVDYFINEMLPLVESVHIYAEARAKLVHSILYYSITHGISDDLVDLMLRLLDDYTVTVQGDVGSKIRIASMDFFLKVKPKPSKLYELNRKLARISCEPMEKLRMKALTLLNIRNDLKMEDFKTEGTPKTFYLAISISRAINVDYGDIMLGYVMSLAGNADTVTMNESALILFQHIETLEDEAKLQLLDSLLDMLKVPPEGIKNMSGREKSLLKAALKTFTILFDYNLCFPETFNYDRLYTRCYNLHINTNDIHRVTLVVKIFRTLILYGGSACENAAKRLSSLCCNHKDPKVRKASSEAIFEVIEHNDGWNAQVESLVMDTDWGEAIHKNLEGTLTKILLQYNN